MTRYSRRWIWILYGLAVIVLVGGGVAALLVWQARSSSTQEVLDSEAVKDAAIGILDNTASIAEEWVAPDLPDDIPSLTIKQQESLALLSGEVGRSEELLLQVQEPPLGQEQEIPHYLLEALAFLSQAQADLEHGLIELGDLLETLEPLDAAEAAYLGARETLLSAVDSHNQAVAAGSTSFGASILEASSAAESLQESRASLDAIKLEGLDLEAAISNVVGLENTAQRFVEACRKGESNDATGHNSLMAEVQSELSASPASILSSIDISSWLKPGLEDYMQPVIHALDESRALLSSE